MSPHSTSTSPGPYTQGPGPPTRKTSANSTRSTKSDPVRTRHASATSSTPGSTRPVISELVEHSIPAAVSCTSDSYLC